MAGENDIFKIKNIIKPLKGRVLISEPFLSDVYFKHSVVFLTEHNDEGTIGFVINNRIELNICDVMNDFPKFDAAVSIGGPVSNNTIHFIHTLGKAITDSIHVLDNIYWGGNMDELKDMVKSGVITADQVRFFIGYSGWMPKQLDNEIAQNSWVVVELSSSEIMNCQIKGDWNQTLEKLGEKYRSWANFPDNPAMN